MRTLEPTSAVELAAELIASMSTPVEVVCECAWCETGLSIYCIGPFTRSDPAANLDRLRDWR